MWWWSRLPLAVWLACSGAAQLAAAEEGPIAEVRTPSPGEVHYRASERWAGQGDMLRARQELAAAEVLAPGLPFVSADAADALRHRLDTSPLVTAHALPAHGLTARSWPWALLASVGAGALLAWAVMRLARPGPTQYKDSTEGVNR